MTRWTLRILGITVVQLDKHRYEFEEEDAALIGGGSTHDFERDIDPLSPTDHLEWEWEEEGRFGFG